MDKENLKLLLTTISNYAQHRHTPSTRTPPKTRTTSKSPSFVQHSNLSYRDVSPLTHSQHPLNNQTCHNTIFERLYSEYQTIQTQRHEQEYQSRRLKEEQQLRQCTFSPNVTSRLRTAPVEDNEEFYRRNQEWLKRRDLTLKELQIELNEERFKEPIGRPKINRSPLRCLEAETVVLKQGVVGFLNRQKKARDEREQKIQQMERSARLRTYTQKTGGILRK